jgi:hypothetical protein
MAGRGAVPGCATLVAADGIPASASELHKLRESRCYTRLSPRRVSRWQRAQRTAAGPAAVQDRLHLIWRQHPRQLLRRLQRYHPRCLGSLLLMGAGTAATHPCRLNASTPGAVPRRGANSETHRTTTSTHCVNNFRALCHIAIPCKVAPGKLGEATRVCWMWQSGSRCGSCWDRSRTIAGTTG